MQKHMSAARHWQTMQTDDFRKARVKELADKEAQDDDSN